MLNRTDTVGDGREPFQALIGHLVAHVDGATEANCAECRVLRDRYRQDRIDRHAVTEAPYRWRRPSLARRWLDALLTLPYVLVDNIGGDDDPAFLRRLMLALFLLFGAAVALWLVAWALR